MGSALLVAIFTILVELIVQFLRLTSALPRLGLGHVGTDLWQRHIGHDDTVQGTWGILGRFVGVTTRMILILEMLICPVAFRGRLPGHCVWGHANGGFGRGGSGFAAEMVAGHAESARHDGEEDLP